MLSNFPAELVLKIVTYVNDGDYISFANTNRRFLNLLSSERTELNLFAGYTGNVSFTRNFLFRSPATTAAITKLDVGNCYWLDPSLLSQLIIRLSTSLTSLHVQGTKLSSLQVATILKECPGIGELSVSFFKDDTSFWLPETKIELKDLSVFQDLVPKLNQLTRLSLHGNMDSFHNFMVFLGLFETSDSLGSLHVELSNAKNRDLHLHQGDYFLRLLNQAVYLQNLTSLTKVTCRIHNGNQQTNILWGQFVEDIISSLNKCNVLWYPHDRTFGFFSWMDREASAMFIVDEKWSDDILKYHGMESATIRPTGYSEVNRRFLREAITAFLDLKLICCSYDPEAFLEFAMKHVNLRVLQFGGAMLFPAPLAGEELVEGLGYLKSLEKFSIDPFNFQSDDRDRPPYSLNDPLNLAIIQLGNSCAFLNELEIGVYTNPEFCIHLLNTGFNCDRFQANSCALETISNLSNLDTLTLAYLDVDSTTFLHPILAGCRKLKSLRLTNVYSNVNPLLFPEMLANQLQMGLPLSKNLQDFRWETGLSKNVFEKPDHPGVSMKQVTDLLDALKLCPSLQRMVLIADFTVGLDLSGTKALDWPSLVLACIISPTVDWENCRLQINSAHPAFQSYFGPSKRDAADRLAPHHYQEMILFETNVANMPY